jgi:hypothetical protein
LIRFKERQWFVEELEVRCSGSSSWQQQQQQQQQHRSSMDKADAAPGNGQSLQ